ncbi:MAG: alkaline phosphatase family protein [Robiginitomaculum sp.]|nr:MAG: alkaline phosphatase family protein [Robiginitomaculum sp.]
MRSFLTVLLALILIGCQNAKPSKTAIMVKEEPIVIMIGIDGLRWDAIDRHPAPELNAIAEAGVRAQSMIPVMPSLTFVNFYSLATGLYAENTGITGNMPYSIEYDAVMGRKMHSESRWWGGEPIWVTAEKQNIRTAAMFWLGSEAEIKGVRPSHWSKYEHYKPHAERVENVLNWLAMDAPERPRFITIYFSDVDSALHRYGPETPEEGNAIAKVDASITSLRAGIEKLGLSDRVNLIIVSDHGITPIDPDFLVYLDDYIDLKHVFVPSFDSPEGPRSNPFAHLFVKDKANIDMLYNKLVNAHPHMKAYKRADIPKSWHLDSADRTGDIFVVLDGGGVDGGNEKGGGMVFARSMKSVYKHAPTGMHGYDRFDQDMGATFIAMGPNFKVGVKAKTFENVEVYGIIARILDITPAKTDGDIKRVEYFLK